MNVKEPHIVTGMSRDSAVSRQNPNLVYEAHNIRITTKDGKNSLLSVTNERGTQAVTIASGSADIDGIPIGDAVIDKYIVLFTHKPNESSNPDHIYRCEMGAVSMKIVKVFEGDANFNEESPIETLPVFENEAIQKVYWVDGVNQPRLINVSPLNPDLINDNTTKAYTDINLLEFSPSVSLGQTFTVTKSASGGEFPVGTIQYAFSYYKLNGQETRLIDVSPMYYLSPQDKGLDATEISYASFRIKIFDVDTSFDKVRVYAIVRTQENVIPQSRVVGDFDIIDLNIKDLNNNASNPKWGVDVYDNGAIGRTVAASSLYFIGGERLVASTLAQKDNTLFLGNIKLTTPTLEGIKKSLGNPPTSNVEVSNIEVGYNRRTVTTDSPLKTLEYYGYEPDNNRSSYFVKTFKYLESYKLGFIAQYENGQWSEPINIGIATNNVVPVANTGNYERGGFSVTLGSSITAALWKAGFKRIAPVVVYPRPLGRRTVAQGILCPTLSTKADRDSNSPWGQSSWFFRFNTHNAITDLQPLADNSTYKGEIQCMDNFAISGASILAPQPDFDETKYSNWFFMNTHLVTLHSPDIECAGAGVENIDLTDTVLQKMGNAYLARSGATVIDHFLETENIGVNSEHSQIVKIKRAGFIYRNSACLYCDSAVDHDNNDEVGMHNQDFIYGWVTYPWHRQGSLNNQAALSTKQKSQGYNARTAMLKRNITARAHFARTIFNNSASNISMIGVPKVFSSDQLSGVSLNANQVSHIYYGNIDKVIVPDNGFYYALHGWRARSDGKKIDDPTTQDITVTEYSERANENEWWLHDDIHGLGSEQHKVSDPVSMKYKSSPHVVVYLTEGSSFFQDNNCGAESSYSYMGGLHVAELVRNGVDNNTKFGDSTDITADAWIRCGESVEIASSGSPTTMYYLQGDCYFQMYDCLKTYPFTEEDTNSVIEIFSTMIESYINLDFKYDRNRGASNNVALSPINFNLYNNPAYTQSGNFFSYHQLDYSQVRTRNFPNVVTWSLEKHFGEDVDNWASIDSSNVVELDGAYGKINKLVNYKNDIYCFQDIGFSQLLFNSRVQIPTSDNEPIEITNGGKMQGKRYISSQIGCTNKWSVIETPIGLYFNDDILRSTYIYNGQLKDLSTEKGMKSWMNTRCTDSTWDPSIFENCKAFYDKIGHDIYWVYGDTALVYSEILGQYMSFMDYGHVPLLESLGRSTYAIVSNYSKKTSATIKMQTLNGIEAQITFNLASSYTSTINLVVEWRTGDRSSNPRPAAIVDTETIGTETVVTVIIYTCAYYTSDLYKPSEIAATINTELPAGLSATASGNKDMPLAYRDGDRYTPLSTYLTNNTSSPFWELGKGSYNRFFGVFKPHWLTFISNQYPTENKIYNNLAWRDIVTVGSTTKPFSTFDHVRVWTEHQDTLSVRLTNNLSEDSSRQPISYSAATSNLRKKFNVWHCQIPRDKIAPNTSRARISNPWAYIKLSCEDVGTERHELMDLEVTYFM